MFMAAAIKHWTLDEVHSLPDDGNKYELVRGELFVTPPPSNEHETIIARLSRILVPYVDAQGLGLVYHARSVVRAEGSEVEPDLFVRPGQPSRSTNWDNAPIPLLAVEVLSGSTRRRDLGPKRDFYIEDARVVEYWIVNPEARSVRVVKPGVADEVCTVELTWSPHGAGQPLRISVQEIF
jgi:Uma2 family endonuclease